MQVEELQTESENDQEDEQLSDEWTRQQKAYANEVDSSDESVREDEDDIQAQIKDIPYEMLVKADIKTDKRMKKSNKNLKKNKLKVNRKRLEDPNAPKERSAKLRVNIVKTVFGSNNVRGVDPRFAGEPMDDFQKHKFFENYGFINELKEKENKDTAKDLRKLKKKKVDKDHDLIQKLHGDIGQNKSSIKAFRREENFVRLREEVRQESRDSGQYLKTVDFKRAVQSKVMANKSMQAQERRKFKPKSFN